jgi:galactose mutarotase-like enzyme
MDPMITIENDFLRASFVTKGAEWRSFVEKVHGREFLWQADPKFWGKSAPVLFPIVGSLKGGQYEYQGKTYKLPRHGFARDKEFRVKEQESWRVVFALDSDDETRQVFPFDFTLEIEYRLWKRVIHTSYRVVNTGQEPMLFSVGAHPAFNLPFFGEGEFEEGFLDFEQTEPLVRWLLNDQGLLSGETRPLPHAGRSLMTTRPLFAEDALVLKGLKSSRIALRQKDSGSALSMEFPGFPYFGLWSAPGAPFVCLEPWCGVADSVTATGRLEDKEGINRLDAGGVFQRSFAVTVEG